MKPTAPRHKKPAPPASPPPEPGEPGVAGALFLNLPRLGGTVSHMADAKTESGSFRLCGGRVIDPAAGIDRIDDLLVTAGRIESVGGPANPRARAIDVAGLIICPGLIDMHVHLREPGAEHKETIASGTRAAAAGGFSAVACMPNTQPAIDNLDTLGLVRRRARTAAAARVYPTATVTVGRRGAQLVDLAALKNAGAVAFTDDGDGVENDDLMRAAMQTAAEIDALLIQHCEYKSISAGGVMHQGGVCDRLGLPGLDPRSEEDMIARDIALVRETGARYHVAHISTARAVQLVRDAKSEGLPVSAEVCPHHLLLTDEACSEQDPNTKMHPPLRTQEDVAACRTGLADGTIDCIVTDHAPHTAAEKSVGFLQAPPGIVGLETALPLAAQALLATKHLDWPRLIRRMSTAPAALLRIPGGSLARGVPADITLIDPEHVWRIDPARFQSKGRNTPFGGREVVGCCVATFVGGRLVHGGDSRKKRLAAEDATFN